MKRSMKILCAKKGRFLFVIIPDDPEIGFYGYKIDTKTGKGYSYCDDGFEWSSLQESADIHIELFKEVWNVDEKLWRECNKENTDFLKKIGLLDDNWMEILGLKNE
ncbi:MAG: hypothetical protein GXO18_04820 [Aquificae bacterium]|nr:hypothetical protein [Aquificota bacterium]